MNESEDIKLDYIEPIGNYADIHHKIKNEERLDVMNRITHTIAIIILILFVTLLLFQAFIFQDKQIVPDYFISIVSVIIGFYFAKSPLFK